jgi:hypothetical protein
MILNAYEKHDENPGQTIFYVPVDPRYLYPENGYSVQTANNREHLFADDSNSADAYGLEQLITQRQEVVLFKARLLFSELYERYKLRDANLYRISLDQCTCTNLIYELGDVLDNQRLQLERQIIGLEQEKRKEMANYFRDVSFLRKELRETLIERLEDEQGARVLLNDVEALP